MKILRLLVLPFLALAAFPALPAGEPLLPFETGVPAATHPELYSFADLYRLALTGEPYGGFRFDDAPAQVRAASLVPSSPALPAATAEVGFTVSPPRDGQGWALVLAGLFACAWVANRRLASPY